MKVKHQYDVVIYWIDGTIENKSVLAINEFQAKSNVVSDSKNTGLFNADDSKATIAKYNVALSCTH